jgi:hypothetical protein
MIRLHLLTPEGREAFRQFIEARRSGAVPSLTIDRLLGQYSSPFEPSVEVDERARFRSKLEMAKHLRLAFERAGVEWRNALAVDGLWNWLSALWFEQLVEGRSKPLAPDHYILDEGRLRYRHIIRSAFMAYCIYGEELPLLYRSPGEWPDLWEQIVGRAYLFKSRQIMSIIRRLCWDEQNRERKGASTWIREQVWRLLNQFMCTYDVGSMNPPEILRLMPQLADLLNRVERG